MKPAAVRRVRRDPAAWGALGVAVLVLLLVSVTLTFAPPLLIPVILSVLPLISNRLDVQRVMTTVAVAVLSIFCIVSLGFLTFCFAPTLVLLYLARFRVWSIPQTSNFV